MSAEMLTPAWMHDPVTAEQYDSWSEEQCADIEVVDGIVVVSPRASIRHNRLARLLANAVDAAAGIPFYWRVEQAPTVVPLVYTYALDAALGRYREGDVFTGAVKAVTPFPVEVDLGAV